MDIIPSKAPNATSTPPLLQVISPRIKRIIPQIKVATYREPITQITPIASSTNEETNPVKKPSGEKIKKGVNSNPKIPNKIIIIPPIKTR